MGDEPLFVNVTPKEGADDVMELPCENDGKLLLSTVQAQFPFAIGLKYRSSTGAWRGVKAENNILEPPVGGWEDQVYIITESDALKRKTSENDSDSRRKSRKSAKLLEDLIVLGIPFSTTQEELYQYFNENCGEVAFCELKVNRDTKKSRGFGFLRFVQEEGAQEALRGPHMLEGRRLEIRLARKKDEVPMKLFIGKLLNGTTKEDVEDYFSDFGDLTDVFVPDGRGFAFVTFADQEDAQKVLRLSHVLKGNRIHVTPAIPKEAGSQNSNSDMFSRSNENRHSTRNNQQPSNDELATQLKDMLGKLINSRR